MSTKQKVIRSIKMINGIYILSVPGQFHLQAPDHISITQAMFVTTIILLGLISFTVEDN